MGRLAAIGAMRGDSRSWSRRSTAPSCAMWSRTRCRRSAVVFPSSAGIGTPLRVRRGSATRRGEWHVTGTFDGERFRLTEPPGPPLVGDRDRGLDFSPACDEPDVVEPSHGVAEWEAATQIDGVFDSRDLVAAWVSDPGGDWDGPFVGNLVVVPGAAQAAVARVREHYAGALCVIERDAPTAVELAAVQRELTNEDARAILGTIQSAAADERRGVVVATIWLVDEAAMDYADQRWGDLVELRGLLRPV